MNEKYKYIGISLISCFLGYSLQPTATSSKEFFSETKTKVEVRTKTVTQNKASNKCVASVVIKPDGTQTISTTSMGTAQANVATTATGKAEVDTKTGIASSGSKAYGLGISAYYPIRGYQKPFDWRELTIGIRKEMTSFLSFGVFGSINGQINAGIELKF